MLDRRTVRLSVLAILVAVCVSGIAHLLTALIGLVTNFAYYGRVSTAFSSPAQNHLGLWAVGVPVIGGVFVGLMARYGSRAIRGHGIPEAMEQVLLNGSKIPPRITFLKPLSAAIAIGTGGPFGAEGPIIATGGALGSVVGQMLPITATERKTLLAAGAAAGMTAIFGTPVSGVLIAVELLLFEFRGSSLVPVALACATAAGIRGVVDGHDPVFPMPNPIPWSGSSLIFYILLGAILGLAAVWITRMVYAIEDAFERLPIHWMWWPALGGLAVGLVGLVAPRTLGVGYDNITHTLDGTLTGNVLLILVVMKLISWAVSLGSGTSGGTLAPLLTIGGGLGGVLGGLVAAAFPQAGIDPRLAALVGMAAIFAGASRALTTSLVFAFEATLQPAGIVPLLGGCTASYLVSSLLMPNTIMTEKIARRGVRVPSEYGADYLAQTTVQAAMTSAPYTLSASGTLAEARRFLRSGTAHSRHQGYPVVDEQNKLIGVVTRRDLLAPETDESATDGLTLRQIVRRAALTIASHQSLREATNLMVAEDIGRLVVVSTKNPEKITGILTRGDLLRALRPRLQETQHRERHIRLRNKRPQRESSVTRV